MRLSPLRVSLFGYFDSFKTDSRKLAIKMYYGGVSGRGVGKILQMNKSNVMNWIKKERQKGG